MKKKSYMTQTIEISESEFLILPLISKSPKSLPKNVLKS